MKKGIGVLRERKEGRREGEGCGCFAGRRPDRRDGAQGLKAAAERWSSGTDDGGAARKKEEDLASRRQAVPSAHNRTNGGGATELPYEMKVLLALRWLDGAAGGCDGDDLHCGEWWPAAVRTTVVVTIRGGRGCGGRCSEDGGAMEASCDGEDARRWRQWLDGLPAAVTGQ
ncbi:homeodomain-interacting protein kinase 3 isoform X1 [Sesbania bispinosa]|nr:homeodomain-interacting protein kinase 3 isoform X1 [Sesbania bispinosa]